MVDVAPAEQSGGLKPPAGTVLVADADRCRSDDLAAALRQAGFVVRQATSWAEVLVELAEHTVHVAVMDSHLADISALLPAPSGGRQQTARRDPSAELGLIFAIEAPDCFDWPSYLLLDNADYLVTPRPPAELVWRVRALADRMAQRAHDRAGANRLRVAVREILDGVRATSNPTAMTERFLEGVTDVFGPGHASFTTFLDRRVPQLSCRSRPGAATLDRWVVEPHEPAMRELAADLWSAGAALTVNPEDGQPAPAQAAELFAWASAQGARNSLVIPVGEGDRALGLLWVASSDIHRSWAPIEISLLQHLAGNVCYGLMQSQLSAQQAVFVRMQRLDQAKNDFLETVNHELRTPLTSLTAYLDLVRDGMGGEIPRGARDMLDVVARNAKRLGLLVEDVLSISRLTANNPEVDWGPVDLTALLGDVVDALRGTASLREVDLTMDARPGLVVQGDAAQLRQVFANITDNAVKFTPAGGRVQVKLAAGRVEERTVVHVVVADTGMGIPDDDLPEIFQSFFRGSNAQSAAVPGTGLGLAIAQGLVDAHDGRVSVSSTLGAGTTVRVQIPVERQTQDLARR